MTRQHAIPDDFPKEPSPGVVTGAHPKLLVREKDGRYYIGLTDNELQTRYEVCEDLARQLSTYTLRKMLGSGGSLADAFAKVERSVKGKVSAGEWDFSPA